LTITHVQNYGEVQQRDIWEYELNLTQKENELLLGHIWEVLGEKYDYYFLTKNCASRMGEVLDILDGVNVTPKNPMWVTPHSLLQNMAAETIDGRSLIKTIKYHPSRQSRFYRRFSNLAYDEQKKLTRLVSNMDELDSPVFSQLPASTQYRLLDTLLDYFQYVRDENKKNEDINNVHYPSVLSKRFKMPAYDDNLDFNAKSTRTLKEERVWLELDTFTTKPQDKA